VNKIASDHLARQAYVYIRQSTPGQVKHNLESQRMQYAVAERARALGWQEVEIVDEDLGISASGTNRPGFERLLHAVCDGKVGAVFSFESASRLARNGREWHTLLEFCSVMGVLLIDVTAVYDPRLVDDRMILGMKGTISEMEVANFRARGQAALQQMAERGALVRRVAIGFVKGPDDRIEKSPDARIRSAIELVFDKFSELRSVRQVFLWFDRQQIQLPVAIGPEDSSEILWRPARYHAVHSILKNPIYAGAYAYGRSKTVVRLVEGKKQAHRVKRTRREEWTVLLRDHHERYIDWDVYENNQKMIAQNENAASTFVRGSVRSGSALLAGLLRCGHCGAKLHAQYPTQYAIRYACSGYRLNGERTSCVLFGGLRADQMVSEQLLQCLSPLSMNAAMDAIVLLSNASDERIRQKALALEQARYEVTRARRQYDAIDPDNRMVAAELERRWNRALEIEAQLEEELEILKQSREHPLTNQQKNDLIDFARDLPRLWNAPQSSPEHKKRLLRIALKEIIATTQNDMIRLVLHWQGGNHTQIEFAKVRTGRHRYATEPEVVEIVRKLARMETDARIASVLNRNQQRTPHGEAWSEKRICSLRNRYSIPVHKAGELEQRGEVFVGQAARLLGLTQSSILRLIHTGHLCATQVCANAPWILLTSEVERYRTERSKGNTPPSAFPTNWLFENK
jgi:DNA invertase Pin-like site-specific DNA recombinase